MKQPTKIDITQRVMQQIESENIQIRPRWQFELLTLVKVVTFIGCIILATLAVSAFVSTLRTDMFRDYLQFGRSGVIDLIKTLPWLGLVVTGVVSALLIAIIKNSKPMHRNALVPVIASLFVVLSIGTAFGLFGTQQSLPSKLANGFRLGNEPIKSVGKVLSVSGNTITIATSNGKTIIIEQKNGTKYTDGLPAIGDTILVLGFIKNGQVSAEAIKVEAREAKIEQQSQPEVLSVEQPKQVTEQAKTPDTPAPAAPVASSKVSGPAPVSVVTPPAFVKTISITSIGAKQGSLPNYKYKVSWSANFSSPLGYKMVWAVAPAIPTYPLGSNQNYYYDSSSAGWGYVVNNLSPSLGTTYNVRVCEYMGGTCSSVYSSTSQVSFP